MRTINEKRFSAIVQEIAGDCSCNDGYCFFRRLVETMHPDVRLLVQFKCIEKFKWEESERRKEDIGWHNAGMQWVENGYAKRFADVYDENLTVKEIYLKTISK